MFNSCRSFFSVVPLLSMISGWLFFSFAEGEARSALTARIRKRFTSLYLPLVFWNVVFLAAMLALYAASPTYPLLGELNIHFAKAAKRAYVNAIFAITAHPIGFQFWFVRDLFVTALVSPILWLFLRRAPWVAVAVLGSCWLAEVNSVIFFRPDVVLFFFLGGLVRRHRAALHVGRSATIVFCAIYVGLIALRTLAPYAIDLSNQSSFFRASLWKQVGPLDPTFYFAMDYDLWVRLARNAPLHYYPRLWANFRLHSLGKSVASDDRCWPEMLRVHWREGGSVFSWLVVKAYLRPLLYGWMPLGVRVQLRRFMRGF